MLVRGLSEIAFCVNNLDAMQQFYEHVIGLPLMTRVPKLRVFQDCERHGGHYSSARLDKLMPAGSLFQDRVATESETAVGRLSRRPPKLVAKSRGSLSLPSPPRRQSEQFTRAVSEQE